MSHSWVCNCTLADELTIALELLWALFQSNHLYASSYHRVVLPLSLLFQGLSMTRTFTVWPCVYEVDCPVHHSRVFYSHKTFEGNLTTKPISASFSFSFVQISYRPRLLSPQMEPSLFSIPVRDSCSWRWFTLVFGPDKSVWGNWRNGKQLKKLRLWSGPFLLKNNQSKSL
jgi:hypothetical protein